MPNQLEQLSQFTQVVADTGDIEAIKQFQPVDATTNPSLVLKAAAQAQYQPLLAQAADQAFGRGGSHAAQIGHCADLLAVKIGREILELIPGRISTEVDARLSFDRDATIARAEQLMALYAAEGVAAERVLIKIAATWEGIAACAELERRGINCNLTLLFSFAQAQAAADAGAYLISPFVGRIFDWYKKAEGVAGYPPAEDPGVRSVSRIFNYYKQHGFNTVVMGASFRSADQIRQLAGCDRLTISPDLLGQLKDCDTPLVRHLDASRPISQDPCVRLNEADFRWALNEDAMATEKLAEGIRNFTKDQITLEQQLGQRLQALRH